MPAERQINVRAAVLEALFEEMRRDPSVFLMGEDIGKAGGVLKQTEGLFEEFGAERVIDTPISESGAFGIAVGAAMTGMRPVFEVMFGDFMTLVLDQLVNQAAKVHYMSAGGYRVPIVLRTMIGAGGGLGPQHSQSLHAWTAHIPGLKVVAPSDAADAKGLFKAAVRDDNPVVFLEDRRIHGLRGTVPDGDEVVPLGRAAVKREGTDATVIAVGRTVAAALSAADSLAADGIDIEVVDPRTLKPLDTDTLLDSVRKTSRALVVDIGHRSYGITGEIAATIGEQAFDYLDAPVARLAGPDAPIPFHPGLEDQAIPNADDIAAAVRALVG